MSRMETLLWNLLFLKMDFYMYPRTNPVLQEFLHYHPMNGSKFVEVNTEKDAQKEMDVLNSRSRCFNRS